MVLQVQSGSARRESQRYSGQEHCEEVLQRIRAGDEDEDSRSVKNRCIHCQFLPRNAEPVAMRIDSPWQQFIRTTLVKEGYTTTKEREKHMFNDDDLDNCVTSLWTEPDHVFIHEVMRDQISFIIQAYCYPGARIGAFVHNFAGEVKGKDGKMEEVVFKGLAWKRAPGPLWRRMLWRLPLLRG